MTTISREFVKLTRPSLSYEPEWERERGFLGYVIRAEGPRKYSDGRVETTPVFFVFDRAAGHLVFADDPGMILHAVAKRIGLTPHGGGPLCYRLPDAWMDANPIRNLVDEPEGHSWTVPDAPTV